MDTATAVVIIVVVLVLLFFGYTMSSNSKTTGKAIDNSRSFPSQQVGGACGR